MQFFCSRRFKLDELGLDEEEREGKQITQELEIDMSILDAKSTTRPGTMENGIFYDHDDSNSMLSMNTNQYEERHPGLKDFNDLREEHEKEESEQEVTDDEKQGATARASGPPTAHSSSGAGTGGCFLRPVRPPACRLGELTGASPVTLGCTRT